MASGQEIAKENVEKFKIWQGTRTDDDYKAMVHRGALNRTIIAKECNFAKSALRQNPQLRILLLELENSLRERALLPALKVGKVKPEGDALELDQQQVKRDNQATHLCRLEQENIELKAENIELKNKLERFEALDLALSDLGRLPR